MSAFGAKADILPLTPMSVIDPKRRSGGSTSWPPLVSETNRYLS